MYVYSAIHLTTKVADFLTNLPGKVPEFRQFYLVYDMRN